MKKFSFINWMSALLFGAILVISSFCPAFAQQEKQKIKVGFFKFDGYHDINENGEKSGYGYDLLQEMARYSNWEYEYIGYENSWDEMLEMLENGEIDILSSATKTPEREKKFDFSELSVGTKSTMLVVNEENDNIVFQDYSTYDGIKVGIIANNSANSAFEQLAREKGFKYTYVEIDDMNMMSEALQNGKVDAILTSSLRMGHDELIIEKFNPEPFYFIAKKGNSNLINQVNSIIEKMDIERSGWRTELFNKYYVSDTAGKVAFSLPEWEYIKRFQSENVTLRAIVNPDRAPYSYFEDGEAKGIIIDIFSEISKRAGLKYEIIETKSREEYVNLIKSGQYDIRIDSFFSYYEAETNGYKLTNPYLTATLSRVSQRDNSAEIKSVAVLKWNDSLIINEDQLDNKNIVYHDTLDECIYSILKGKTDCTYMYTYSAQKYVQADEKNKLKSVLVTGQATEFAIGVSNNCDPMIISIYDKAINSLGDRFPQAVLLNYMEYKGKASLISYIYNKPMLAVLIVVLAFVIIFLLTISFIRTQHAKKQQLLTAQLARFMGYVCKSNDAAIDVNIRDKSCVRYFHKNGRVETSKERCTDVTKFSFIKTLKAEDAEFFSNSISELEIDKLFHTKTQEKYFEFEVLSAGGNYQWYSYTIQAIKADESHPKNIALFMKNIDLRKRESDAKNQVLSDALETARYASEAKGNFMSRMSHEIRTPLNAIIGYMELAKMSWEDMLRVKDCLEKSGLAAQHLLSIINDVLDISSIESGKMKIANESFSIRNLLSAITVLFYNQARAKGIRFETIVNGLNFEWLMGDQLRVNQILMNLLSNAVKFTNENGKVILTVTQLAVNNKIVHIQFEVEDNGIGISEEYMKRLFTPFEQEDASTARKYGGTGLGLSITNNLVNMMSGSIHASSVQNKGTVFTVSLPFECSSEEEKKKFNNYNFSEIRALVFDNIQAERSNVTSLLTRCNIEADCVTNEETALKQLIEYKNTEKEYKMCIIDWDDMEDKCFEIAKRIRREIGGEVPVIFITAYDVSEITEKAKDIVASKVISKPLFQSSIFDLLISHFGINESMLGNNVEDVDLQGKSILLAEDNQMNKEIAVALLRRAGMTVDVASDGKEAAEMFIASSENKYDAILMDLQMPILNGYESTELIRGSLHKRATTIPIIAMTADAFVEDIAKVMSSGMNAHVAKPVDYKKLLNTLKQEIERS